MCYTNSRYKLDCHLLPPGRSGLVRASYVVLFVSLVYIFPPLQFHVPHLCDLSVLQILPQEQLRVPPISAGTGAAICQPLDPVSL